MVVSGIESGIHKALARYRPAHKLSRAAYGPVNLLRLNVADYYLHAQNQSAAKSSTQTESANSDWSYLNGANTARWRSL